MAKINIIRFPCFGLFRLNFRIPCYIVSNWRNGKLQLEYIYIYISVVKTTPVFIDLVCINNITNIKCCRINE